MDARFRFTDLHRAFITRVLGILDRNPESTMDRFDGQIR